MIRFPRKAHQPKPDDNRRVAVWHRFDVLDFFVIEDVRDDFDPFYFCHTSPYSDRSTPTVEA